MEFQTFPNWILDLMKQHKSAKKCEYAVWVKTLDRLLWQSTISSVNGNCSVQPEVEFINELKWSTSETSRNGQPSLVQCTSHANHDTHAALWISKKTNNLRCLLVDFSANKVKPVCDTHYETLVPKLPWKSECLCRKQLVAPVAPTGVTDSLVGMMENALRISPGKDHPPF